MGTSVIAERNSKDSSDVVLRLLTEYSTRVRALSDEAEALSERRLRLLGFASFLSAILIFFFLYGSRLLFLF